MKTAPKEAKAGNIAYCTVTHSKNVFCIDHIVLVFFVTLSKEVLQEVLQ